MNIKKLSADARLAVQQLSAIMALSQQLTELEQLDETHRSLLEGIKDAESELSVVQQKISNEQIQLRQLETNKAKSAEEVTIQRTEALSALQQNLASTRTTIAELKKAADKELSDKQASIDALEAAFAQRETEIDTAIAVKEKQLDNINRRLAAIKTKLED